MIDNSGQIFDDVCFRVGKKQRVLWEDWYLLREPATTDQSG